MALTIGVCDDCPEQVRLLLQYLHDYPDNDGFELLHSTDPKEFLNAIEEKQPELVFLDIDMGEMSGIRLGDAIKAICPETVIIYITAYEKYALEAFRVRAFHYLLKPVTKEKFYRVLDEAKKQIENSFAPKKEGAFSVKVRGEFVRLPYGDIFYFEKIGHRVKVYTASRELFFYDKLSNLTQQLDKATFLQCHTGYIVNVDKIRSFREKTLYLEGGHELPVSRSYAEEVRGKLAKMLFAEREAT
ncbi:Transcriptional regulatory protein NatR [bioreactor metagenome]|uniref:Transcriptional regulatory protein NatR n=1 Tax=bioreactor metagenome TaxID=1076179 RepID=A0A644XDE4_9ZZZZ